jgi:hypothetical protein
MKALLDESVPYYVGRITAVMPGYSSLPASVQAALLSACYQRAANMDDIADFINGGDFNAAATWLETWAQRVDSRFAGRYREIGAMLRNQC